MNSIKQFKLISVQIKSNIFEATVFKFLINGSNFNMQIYKILECDVMKLMISPILYHVTDFMDGPSNAILNLLYIKIMSLSKILCKN